MHQHRDWRLLGLRLVGHILAMASKDRQTVREEADPILVAVVGALAEEILEVVPVGSAEEVLADTAAAGGSREVVLEEAPEVGSHLAEGIRSLVEEEDHRNCLVEDRMTLLVGFGSTRM